ncbi:MAG: adenylate kinase, partial [Bdellovibrionales bacterium]|nr:adenylate kinase [Bdellovibrionales bacterium]
KGTQAALITKSLGISHISTGDMMRSAVASGSELGEKVKGYMDRGELVPDAVVIDVIKSRLAQDDCRAGFLLDGFPRTALQAEALAELLKEVGMPLSHVIELNAPDQILIERIAGRGASGSGRSDDTAEMAAKRLDVYKEQTLPVSRYYASNGPNLIVVDGVGEVQDIHEKILQAVA